MKTRHPGFLSLSKRRRQRGYASMAMVAVIGTISLFGMLIVFRDASRSHDAQAAAQIRIDYTQKEDAFLRGIVSLLPNKAIDVMRDQSRARANELTWESLFREAISMANAETSVSVELLQATGLQNAVIANPGDQSIVDTASIVSPVVGKSGWVNPGLTQSSAFLLDGRFQDRLPDPLETSSAVALDDELYPVISDEKLFSDAWNTEADLSIGDYPLYNRILYPNIQFGYTSPGSRFVSKRNWWAFSVRFGGQSEDEEGEGIAPIVTKNYVLSLYEIPSQLPMSAEAFMSVGLHADGSSWTNVSVDGDVSAGVLRTEGSFSLPTGRFSGRKGIELGAGTSASGQALRDDFDALGVRESLFAASGVDSYGASLSANSGRVAFVPISRGLDFYRLPDLDEVNTISPTTWDKYSTGAVNCSVKVLITGVESVDDQTPTRIEILTGNDAAGSGVTLERGVNWPFSYESGGDVMPFQTKHTENGRKAIEVKMGKIPDYLASIGVGDVSAANKIFIGQDPGRDANIQEPEFPSVETETVVVLSDSDDLTPWGSSGLSLVTNLRLYFSDDFNTVEATPPAGSGITGTFYPPVSVFAPEKRFGTTLKVRPVDFSGQVGTLSEGENQAFYPLDLKAGTYETVSGDLINADLKPITSPGALPPIYLKNWLVMIEEIH